MTNEEQSRWAAEEEEIMRIMNDRQAQLHREAEERMRIEVQCEAARYKMYLKQKRCMYRVLGQILLFVCGASAATSVMMMMMEGGIRELVAAGITFVSMLMSMHCDRKSRQRGG